MPPGLCHKQLRPCMQGCAAQMRWRAMQKLEQARRDDVAAASGNRVSLQAVGNREGPGQKAETSKADPHEPQQTRA